MPRSAGARRIRARRHFRKRAAQTHPPGRASVGDQVVFSDPGQPVKPGSVGNPGRSLQCLQCPHSLQILGSAGMRSMLSGGTTKNRIKPTAPTGVGGPCWRQWQALTTPMSRQASTWRSPLWFSRAAGLRHELRRGISKSFEAQAQTPRWGYSCRKKRAWWRLFERWTGRKVNQPRKSAVPLAMP